MWSRHQGWDARRVRRWIGTVICLAAVGIAVLVIPRLAPRSPMAIILLCALAVLTMKLVECRVRQWFDHWANRQRTRTTPPEGRL